MPLARRPRVAEPGSIGDAMRAHLVRLAILLTFMTALAPAAARAAATPTFPREGGRGFWEAPDSIRSSQGHGSARGSVQRGGGGSRGCDAGRR